MRPGDQGLADLAGLDEMGVHLDRRKLGLAGYVSRGHAAGAVREGHQDAALHQAAAVVMLVLRDQRVFMFAVDAALPQRSDQMQEPGGLDDGPAGGLECRRGLVGHVRSSSSGARSDGGKPFHQSPACCSQAG